MDILLLSPQEYDSWDDFVFSQSGSTFYQRSAWKKVVEASYSHKAFYLYAKEEGEIKGVLPLFFIKNKLFGKKLVSTPFSPYGGICASDSYTHDLLLSEAKKIAKDNSCRFLELRHKEIPIVGLPKNNSYFSLILELNEDPDVIWNNLNRKVRNAIRKSLNSSLELVIDNELIGDFYFLYSRNMHYLGSPTHSLEFFRQVLNEFPDSAKVISVKHDGTILASMIALFYKDTIISGWAASDRLFNHLNLNNFLYWKVIEKGCKDGYRYFDFGRSIEGSGTFSFKVKWGACPIPLNYYFYFPEDGNIPDISQASNKRLFFSKLWRRLPYNLTNILGPHIRKNYP